MFQRDHRPTYFLYLNFVPFPGIIVICLGDPIIRFGQYMDQHASNSTKVDTYFLSLDARTSERRIMCLANFLCAIWSVMNDCIIVKTDIVLESC